MNYLVRIIKCYYLASTIWSDKQFKHCLAQRSPHFLCLDDALSQSIKSFYWIFSHEWGIFTHLQCRLDTSQSWFASIRSVFQIRIFSLQKTHTRPPHWNIFDITSEYQDFPHLLSQSIWVGSCPVICGEGCRHDSSHGFGIILIVIHSYSQLITFSQVVNEVLTTESLRHFRLVENLFVSCLVNK